MQQKPVVEHSVVGSGRPCFSAGRLTPSPRQTPSGALYLNNFSIL